MDLGDGEGNRSREGRSLTVVALFMVTVHIPVPEHPPPDQPRKVELMEGEALRTT